MSRGGKPRLPRCVAAMLTATATLLLSAVALGPLAGTAGAYISTSGSGAGSSRVASLGAPTLGKAVASGKSVTLSWSAVAAPATGSVSYYVIRDGGSPAGNCASSVAPTTATSCTDAELAPGTHSYVVVAVWRSWSTASNGVEATVAKPLAQSIKFTSSAPSKARAGESTYKVTATASSGLPVSLSVAPSSSSVCSLSGTTSGSTVTNTAVGSCTIYANQEGSESYEAAPQVQQSFSVSRGPQSIEFTSAAPSNASLGGSYEVTAVASSGLPVSLAIESTSRNVCNITGSTSGSRVNFTGTGTCTIAASQSGNTSYEAASTVKQSLRVSKATQTIEFTSTAPSEALVGGTYTVSARSSSGLTVALAVASSSRSVCSLSGSRISFSNAGSCVIDASQSGNSTYEAAAPVEQSFFVGVSLAIASYGRYGSSYALAGEGFPEDSVNIEVCKVDAFPCPSIDLATTATAVVNDEGEWTSSALNLTRSTTYWARATEAESGAISNVYSFRAS